MPWLKSATRMPLKTSASFMLALPCVNDLECPGRSQRRLALSEDQAARVGELASYPIDLAPSFQPVAASRRGEVVQREPHCDESQPWLRRRGAQSSEMHVGEKGQHSAMTETLRVDVPVVHAEADAIFSPGFALE